MSATATLSIRIPMKTRRWLERFAKRRGSAGMAASRILEEARRREDYPAIEFRDTPLGRVAYVQLSHAGRERYRTGLRRRQDVMQRLLAGFSGPECEQLAALLERLVGALDDLVGELSNDRDVTADG